MHDKENGQRASTSGLKRKEYTNSRADDNSKKHAHLYNKFLKACSDGNKGKVIHLLQSEGQQLLDNDLSRTSGTNGFLYACGSKNGLPVINLLVKKYPSLVN